MTLYIVRVERRAALTRIEPLSRRIRLAASGRVPDNERMRSRSAAASRAA